MRVLGALVVLVGGTIGCGAAAEVPDGGASEPDAAIVDAAIVDAAIVDAAIVPDAGAAEPIVAPDRTWTWVDVEGTSCDDGSSTGVGVNLAPDAPGVLVFLFGGGACWDYATCFVLNTAAHGPFAAPQLASVTAMTDGSIVDRDLAGNPFRDWSFVLVPYCTGDLHAGTRVATYADTGGAERTFHHVGRTNLEAILPRLAATFPAAASIAWSGSSAGGFGAVLSHDLARAHFPDASMIVIDDSGPLLEGDAIAPSLRDAWYASWGLDWLDAPCPTCRTDLSALHPSLAARFPSDRTALISSQQDAVIRAYFMLTGAALETALGALSNDVLSGLAPVRTFVTPGEAHVTLTAPTPVRAIDDAELLPWLDAMVSGDATWVSHGP